jgi:hypothetical protein
MAGSPADWLANYRWRSREPVGIPVWLGKLSGTETLDPDCSVEKIAATFHAYEPWQDPYTDEPFLELPQPDHYGYRMKVERPAK